jgi:acyl-CoA hydrolase
MAATTYEDPAALVDVILDELGTDLTVGTPLGIGKGNRVLNELVERARDDPTVELSIWTALTLSKPGWDSELERRLVEPIENRLFGTYPNMTYAELLDDQELPENIEVHQFYYAPGQHVRNATAQQNHHSVNYTHALDAFLEAEPDLLVQLVGVGEVDGKRHYNIGTNTDLSVDLIDAMRRAREDGERETMIVGEVTREMPFMYGDAPIPAARFDAVLDEPGTELSLFGPPSEPVTYADQAVGLRVSTLLRDGGTVQIGIGSLGDAIGWATELRHTRNEAYREAIEALDAGAESEELIREIGGLGPFEEGLYGGTEMFVEAFLRLFEAGVLSREVYDDPTIQRLVNEGRFEEGVTLDALDGLLAEGAVGERIGAGGVEYLKRWGLLREEVSYSDGQLRVDGERIPADLGDPDARESIADHALGEELAGGRVLHGGFFMGSPAFYEDLRGMDDERRKRLAMTSVAYTNALYGDERLKRLQRQDARFINTGMKATVTGGVASDGTADGRVVSGVGGQFNFVNQAHELEDGRSIVMVRATRESGGVVESNIVWNYGHITIPRHLRDIVVTEYGVADLRHKSDAEVIGEMIKIADSRFQDGLIAKAKEAGKLPEDWTLPAEYRDNYPDRIEEALAPFRERGDLPRFPYGSELTTEERRLAESLRNLQSKFGGDGLPELPALGSVRKALFPPAEARPYLERMDLGSAWTPRQFLYKRAVVLALAENDVV